MGDDKKTPPDLYLKSDKVQLETALNKMRNLVENGFSQIDARLADIESRLVERTQRIGTIATVGTAIGSCGFVLALALAVLR